MICLDLFTVSSLSLNLKKKILCSVTEVIDLLLCKKYGEESKLTKSPALSARKALYIECM